MSGIATNVLSAVNVLIKAVQTWTALQRVKEVYDKDEKDRSTGEKVDAAVHATFAILQVTDLALSGASQISKIRNRLGGAQTTGPKVTLATNNTFKKFKVSVCIGTNIAATGCAITNPLAKKGKLKRDDYLNVIAVFSFRSADVLTQFHATYPEVLNWDPKSVEGATNALMTFSEVVNHREKLQNAGTLIKDGVIAFGVRMMQYMRARKNDPQVDIPMRQEEAPYIENLPDDGNQAIAEAVDRLANNQIQVLIKGLDDQFKNLKEIPEILHRHPEFMQNLCCISRKPIRNIVVPDIDGAAKIKYERSAIEAWLRDRPYENPPNWPEQLQFNRQNLKISRDLQNIILQSLQNAAREYLEVEQVIANH